MEPFGIVYLLIDGINDREYVGQTTRTLKKRFKEHTYEKKYIGHAIRSHGKDLFALAVLKVCYSKAELDFWEKYFIKARNTKAPNGYNLTDGGEGTVGLKFTPEHCKNIAASKRGKKLSPEHRAKIAASECGEKNPFFGKQHTDAARAKMAAAHRIETPYKNLLNELNKRQILYIELATLLGIALSTLSEKMHGNRNFTLRDREKLKKFFGLSIDYLLQRDDGLEAILSNRGVSPYKNLVAELESRNMSYTALAKFMGLGVVSISNKMRGKTRFSNKDKNRLVEIFNKPIEYLLQRDDS